MVVEITNSTAGLRPVVVLLWLTSLSGWWKTGSPLFRPGRIIETPDQPGELAVQLIQLRAAEVRRQLLCPLLLATLLGVVQVFASGGDYHRPGAARAAAVGHQVLRHHIVHQALHRLAGLLPFAGDLRHPHGA